jgi:hypothetical protein
MRETRARRRHQDAEAEAQYGAGEIQRAKPSEETTARRNRCVRAHPNRERAPEHHAQNDELGWQEHRIGQGAALKG